MVSFGSHGCKERSCRTMRTFCFLDLKVSGTERSLPLRAPATDGAQPASSPAGRDFPIIHEPGAGVNPVSWSVSLMRHQMWTWWPVVHRPPVVHIPEPNAAVAGYRSPRSIQTRLFVPHRGSGSAAGPAARIPEWQRSFPPSRYQNNLRRSPSRGGCPPLHTARQSAPRCIGSHDRQW
jgi:hypothetical protein